MPTIRATYDGRVLVPDEPLDLPTGSVVEFEPRTTDRVEKLSDLTRLHDDAEERNGAGENHWPDLPDDHPLKELIEIARNAPDDPDSPGDRAAQHDHYLYGSPKRINP